MAGLCLTGNPKHCVQHVGINANSMQMASGDILTEASCVCVCAHMGMQKQVSTHMLTFSHS